MSISYPFSQLSRKHYRHTIVVLLLCFCPAPVNADSAPINMRGMFDNLYGLTLTANKLTYENSENGNGKAVNAQVVFILPSFAFEHVVSNNATNNLFKGLGFANLIQIQTGSGDQGSLWRIRSDLFLPYYIRHGWSDPFFPSDADDWLDRLCLSLNYTNYSDANIGRVYQIGLGVGF